MGTTAAAPAFIAPAAAAAALATVAALAGVIRALLSSRIQRRFGIAFARTKRRLGLRRPRGTPVAAPERTFTSALDEVHVRATARLDATTPHLVPTDPVAYASLSSSRRAELLDEALRAARVSAATAAPPKPQPTVIAEPEWNAAIAFWRVAESLNGRAAAVGFMLCLLREAVEPTHPSLLTQVRQVLTPVAVHTQPFLVAVVDRITDWLT